MAYTLPSPSYRKVGSGGGTNDLMKLIMSLIGGEGDGYDEAKQANIDRYLDVLDLNGGARTRTLDAIDARSGQQEADANKSYNDLRNNMISDLADRGLSGSTKRIAVENSTKREHDAAINRIQDAQREYRSNADERFTDKAMGVMERREDPYPERGGSSALIGQLMGLLGSGGGGGSLDSLVGGGNSRSRSRPGTRKLLAAATLPSPPKYGPHNDFQPQNSGADELTRRRLMGGLAAANSHDGVEGQDRVRYVLSQLQNLGLAEQNPNMGTPEVGFAQTSTSSYEQPYGAYGGGSQQQSAPSYGPAERQQEILRRQAWQRSRANQVGSAATLLRNIVLSKRHSANMFGG